MGNPSLRYGIRQEYFDLTMATELKGIFERSAFSVNSRPVMTNDANMNGSRLTLCIKDRHRNHKQFKARVILQEQTDKKKAFLSKPKLHSRLRALDPSRKQTFLESEYQAKKSHRHSCYRLRNAADWFMFNIQLKKILKYMLSPPTSNPRLWLFRFGRLLKRLDTTISSKDLIMVPFIGDPSLSVSHTRIKLQGVAATKLGAKLDARTKNFDQIGWRAEEPLKFGETEYNSVQFSVTQIEARRQGFL